MANAVIEGKQGEILSLDENVEEETVAASEEVKENVEEKEEAVETQEANTEE